MIKNCVDCIQHFECRGRNIRCSICQKIYRKKYNQTCWQRNKCRYRNRWITHLGGLPITLKEIRNYKGGIAKNSPKYNEAEWTENAKTYYTEEEYYEED